MLPYIRTNEDMINLGYNPKVSVIRIASGNRYDKWVKIHMNGSEKPFWVLCRK